MEKQLTPKQTRQFDAAWKDIDENFDWKKVHSVMKYVQWEWRSANGVPSLEQIKEQAKRLLRQLIGEGKRITGIGTGGLYVQRINCESGSTVYEIVFELTSWETQ